MTRPLARVTVDLWSSFSSSTVVTRCSRCNVIVSASSTPFTLPASLGMRPDPSPRYDDGRRRCVPGCTRWTSTAAWPGDRDRPKARSTPARPPPMMTTRDDRANSCDRRTIASSTYARTSGNEAGSGFDGCVEPVARTSRSYGSWSSCDPPPAAVTKTVRVCLSMRWAIPRMIFTLPSPKVGPSSSPRTFARGPPRRTDWILGVKNSCDLGSTKVTESAANGESGKRPSGRTRMLAVALCSRMDLARARPAWDAPTTTTRTWLACASAC
mmetsp:Transcript_5620/g.18265  ORF Transcript_5620/g.18265 Transcript_5620/m.18265 type:complete len:269 (+) Transcript_5620:1403-2209(+)